MYLQQLSVINFKNYTEAELAFSEGVNAFTGNNGAGKTNLLDAIHYLSLCKSYFNPIDSQQIKQGTDLFIINGTFSKNGAREAIACGVKRNQKKQFKRNKKDYNRLADHIGLFPLVMVSPYDISIIIEGSEERRKFIDNVISQTDNRYLDELITYNKVLINRNALLKRIAETGRYDPELLSVFDEQLIASGNLIFEKRKVFMDSFTLIFNRHYQFLSGDAEQVDLVYESQLLQDDFASLLKKSTEKDRVLERTTTGIHKDELQFAIHGMPMKKFGSQGQQKSFLIALKLAQYSFLYQQKGFKPLLLLDDIFDKLDDNRVTKLMQMVSNHDFGQVFITDTSAGKVENIFKKIDVEVKLFNVTGEKLMGRTNDKSLKEAIEQMLQVYKIKKRYDETGIITAWPNMVGKSVANRTKEIFIHDKKLFLRIESSVIKNELIMMRTQIIEKINNEAKTLLVEEIIFL